MLHLELSVLKSRKPSSWTPQNWQLLCKAKRCCSTSSIKEKIPLPFLDALCSLFIPTALGSSGMQGGCQVCNCGIPLTEEPCTTCRRDRQPCPPVILRFPFHLFINKSNLDAGTISCLLFQFTVEPAMTASVRDFGFTSHLNDRASKRYIVPDTLQGH